MRRRFRDKKPPSRLERRFLLYRQSVGGPELKREFRFHMDRKWRADFAHVESRTLIEVEGGIYVQGRRNRPQGFAADAEKYLEAALDDWRVVRLAELQITAPMIERIVGVSTTAPHGTGRDVSPLNTASVGTIAATANSDRSKTATR